MIKIRGLTCFRLFAFLTAVLAIPVQAEDGITKDRILIGQAAGFTGNVAGASKNRRRAPRRISMSSMRAEVCTAAKL